MNHPKNACELFKNGCNCAQSVFCAFCDTHGIDKETALKLSSSFGGGMGKMREVCGACTGAFLVAGLLYGEDTEKDYDKKSRHYALVRRIADEFKALHGTIICRELLKGIENDSTLNPRKRTAEYYATRPCALFVEDAARILDKIIEENKNY